MRKQWISQNGCRMWLGLLVVLLPLLVGCNLQDLVDRPLRWAVVDENKIMQKLTEVAYQQNPYPESLKNIDELNRRRKGLNDQIYALQQQARDRCLKKTAAKTDSGKTAGPIRGGPEPGRRYRFSGEDSIDCISNIDSDPLIADLKTKVNDINEVIKLKAEHDQKIHRAVRKKFNRLAQENFARDYDLVLNKREGIIVFNKSRKVIDVTDVMTSIIDTGTVIITLTNANEAEVSP